MLKKSLACVLGCVVAASVLSGCYTGGPVVKKPSNTAISGNLKTGLGIVSSVSESVSVADGADGKGKSVFTAAAVLVDEKGKIISCDLDVLQTEITFSAEGKITSDLSAPLQTKDELGANYGMKEYSAIQKEWNEQADAFCNFAIGKNVDDIAGLALDEGGKPTDADLSANCSIAVSDFVKAVSIAAENATVRGAGEGDSVHLGISAMASNSKDAADGTDGSVDIAATFVAASMNSEGKFTSAYTDAVETVVNFTADGQITGDLSKEIVSKYEQKEAYNMKQFSEIQKEWYEQADGFSSFMVGRTADEVAAAVTDGYASDADLAATCSINMYDLVDAAKKASASNNLKTGLGIVSSVAESTSAADGADGKGKTTLTAAGILVDGNGKIVACDLDVLQAEVTFSPDGKITSDLSAPIKTKQELGTDYGMKEYSPIQKEWDEQAAAFCDFVVGKTVDEVVGISLDEGGKPTDADLSAGCSIAISDFVKAVAAAAENASVRGAHAGDSISVGISSMVSDSKDAADGADGSVNLAATLVAASMNGAGKFTSAYTDAVETVVNFSADGQITSDLSKEIISKYELKEDYNMKPVSGIQKEWYEQADGFSSFMVGRTADEVAAAVTDGYASDADLAATCSINMYGLVDAAAKAAAK